MTRAEWAVTVFAVVVMFSIVVLINHTLDAANARAKEYRVVCESMGGTVVFDGRQKACIRP